MPARFQTIEVNPLQEHWHGNVWVAPKGAVRDNRIWLNKTISEYRNGYITASSFSVARLSYYGQLLLFGIILSVSLSNVSSNYEPLQTALSLSLLLPGSLLIYGPPVDQTLTDIDKVSLFYNTFRDVGRVIYSEFAGDGWAKDLEYFEDNKGNI